MIADADDPHLWVLSEYPWHARLVSCANSAREAGDRQAALLDAIAFAIHAAESNQG